MDIGGVESVNFRPTLKHVNIEISLHVLAYNLKRAMKILKNKGVNGGGKLNYLSISRRRWSRRH